MVVEVLNPDLTSDSKSPSSDISEAVSDYSNSFYFASSSLLSIINIFKSYIDDDFNSIRVNKPRLIAELRDLEVNIQRFLNVSTFLERLISVAKTTFSSEIALKSQIHAAEHLIKGEILKLADCMKVDDINRKSFEKLNSETTALIVNFGSDQFLTIAYRLINEGKESKENAVINGKINNYPGYYTQLNNNVLENNFMMWKDRDKSKYPDKHSAFQFIADHHPSLRTTGGLNNLDPTLYGAHRRAMLERATLEKRGEKVEPLPAGYVPLIDKTTEINARKRQPKRELRKAWATIAQDRRDKKNRGLS